MVMKTKVMQTKVIKTMYLFELFLQLLPHLSHSSRPTSKVTPQEQRMEAEGNADEGIEAGGIADEGNEDEMYLFSDDESENIEAELDEDSVSTDEPPPKRNFISIQRKIEIAEAAVRGKTIPGFILRGLARENNLQGNQIRRYIKSLPELRRLVHKKGGNSTKHSGRPTSLANAKDLCEWVVNLRREGMPISINMVILRASQLDERFHRKKMQTKYSIVRRILRSCSIVIRAKTHQAQRHPKEMVDEAKHFVSRITPLLASPNHDQRYIINMDQTPVFFSMVPNKTLNIAGERSINVRTSTGSTMRLTCAVTVSAAGDILRPFIVFKGKRDGRISREFGNPEKSGFLVDCSYMCQDRAWMDEAVMLQWVKEVLEPWSKHVPTGIVPYLLLDSYKCHLMSSVVHAIQDLGIEVEHIPGGCTGLVQPLDVGVNKPLKNRIRRKWEEYMLEEGLAMTVSKPPTRQQMATWVTQCLDDLSEHIVKAAWRRNGYSYFPQEEVQVQVQLNIEQDALLDDEVDISSLDETLTDTTSEAPNNNNE